MPTDTFTQRDVFLMDGRIVSSTQSTVLRDTGLTISGRVDSSITDTIRDTATILDASTPSHFTRVREVFNVSGNAEAGRKLVETLRDDASIFGVADGQRFDGVFVSEVFTATDRYFVTINVRATSVGYVSDNMSASTTRSLTARDVARITGKAVTDVTHTERETATALGRGVPSSVKTLTVRDLVYVSDSHTSVRSTSATLRDVAVLLGRALSSSSLVETVRDSAYLYDEAFPSTVDNTHAYTCHVQNWAMSTYRQFPFATMSSQYVGGTELHDIEQTPTTNDSYWTTGYNDFGISDFKRPLNLYMNGTATEPLLVTVRGDVGLENQTYTYEMSLRDQGAIRTNRAQIGRGFRARSYQFTMTAEGFEYKVVATEVDLAASTRRY